MSTEVTSSAVIRNGTVKSCGMARSQDIATSNDRVIALMYEL